ncbi:substrate-binding domain-containing protein [Tessaracoccus aquimaris]|uniref:substrate-binding domain-containing protein n=1 Tax=Tessaracoccus aquimaris TaxID=1332264 RepID=UPI001314527D|nr:substrate-binding domain-containing protein [Tessaracoccus aquimaris]
MSTIRQDFPRIGTELVHLVIDQIRGSYNSSKSRIIIPTEFVPRGTTAPPRT